jgi:P pilus assembly chaperone PapD
MKAILTFFFSLVVPALCLAQVSAETSYIYFTAEGSPVQNVAVFNNDAVDTLLVEATAVKVINPGAKDEKQEPTKDLLVSPRRFTMQPSSSRVARILLRKKPDPESEDIYRITFAPVEDSDRAIAQKKSASPQIKVKVLVGVGLLVFAQPVEQRAVLKWHTDEANVIHLESAGNVNLYMDQVHVCNHEGDSCEERKEASARMYVGREVAVKAKPGATIKLTRKINDFYDTVMLEGSTGELVWTPDT